MSATLGVRPPSDKPAHSSTRAAPAAAAARTPCSDSTLISILIAPTITPQAPFSTNRSLRKLRSVPLRIPGRWLAEHVPEVADEVALVGVAEVRRERRPVDLAAGRH